MSGEGGEQRSGSNNLFQFPFAITPLNHLVLTAPSNRAGSFLLNKRWFSQRHNDQLVRCVQCQRRTYRAFKTRDATMGLFGPLFFRESGSGDLIQISGQECRERS